MYSIILSPAAGGTVQPQRKFDVEYTLILEIVFISTSLALNCHSVIPKLFTAHRFFSRINGNLRHLILL